MGNYLDVIFPYSYIIFNYTYLLPIRETILIDCSFCSLVYIILCRYICTSLMGHQQSLRGHSKYQTTGNGQVSGTQSFMTYRHNVLRVKLFTLPPIYYNNGFKSIYFSLYIIETKILLTYKIVQVSHKLRLIILYSITQMYQVYLYQYITCMQCAPLQGQSKYPFDQRSVYSITL